MPIRVLVVCSGNICRSPTAEAVLRALVDERGRAGEIEVDSAGTGDWHVGEPPDERAQQAARRRGLVLAGAARQVQPRDFGDFDLIVAVDGANLQRLRRVAPPGTAHKLRTLAADDVPDPYYGGERGFDDVLAMIEQACSALLDEVP